MNRTILRGAQVITMAPGRPDVDRVDILIEGDCIAELGSPPDRRDAESIDLSGRIVIPGLINAHLHTWQAGLRCVGADCAPLAAALHASIANIEAVMIAGRWRKRNHSLVETDLDAMKSRLLESSQRLLHGDHLC